MCFEPALERVDSDARIAGDRGERFAAFVSNRGAFDVKPSARRSVRVVDLNAGRE